MCGIVGYVGDKAAQPILIKGLKRLEYRGYDSAGIAVQRVAGGCILEVHRSEGRIVDLESKLGETTGTQGIGHTRWATHGAPTEANAHPHCDTTGCIAVVHNGIIENHHSLRVFLEKRGAEFRSETDTEVIAHLIRFFYRGNIEKAVRMALRKVEGTYGLAVMMDCHSDHIVVARRGSPLLVGVGDGECIVASDGAAIIAHTNTVIHLNDDEVCSVWSDGCHTLTLDGDPVDNQLQDLEISLEQIELGGYEHFMMKEIAEQPNALRTCMSGRIRDDVVRPQNKRVYLGGLLRPEMDAVKKIKEADRIIFTACGTAWHASLIGQYLFEDIGRTPALAEYASELRYRNPVIGPRTVVIAVSQSGETADTLAALKEAKSRGATVLGVVNVVGSSIARETDAGVYTHVGPEIGVASTKAFTGQVAVMLMLAAEQARRIASPSDILRDLVHVPDQIEAILGQSETIRKAAADCANEENWLYLGRGYNYPVALEGALKLKEISYIHAEGMPAAEMKHGPIALIRGSMPAVFIATQGSQYTKILSNIEEVRSRGGRILAVATEGDDRIPELADHVFFVPDVAEPIQPLLTVVPLQLLAYHAAVIRGCDVDRPRNLAKSVTVE